MRRRREKLADSQGLAAGRRLSNTSEHECQDLAETARGRLRRPAMVADCGGKRGRQGIAVDSALGETVASGRRLAHQPVCAHSKNCRHPFTTSQLTAVHTCRPCRRLDHRHLRYQFRQSSN
uniref:Uncharacterized protein n=1 Tax=Plectus sambesii TaxID=2011161 RepID=A0A914V3H5_9BILA